ncbi:MAG: Uma2 family endonuclease [Elainellaceae cyanobacterium]
MTVTIAKWTLDQYHQMIEAGILIGQSVELLNGEIIEVSPEGPEHAQLSTDGADYLRELLEQDALIRDAKPITLPNSNSEPEPDIAIVQPLRDRYRTCHPYPEHIFWLIEYASSSLAKDLDAKRKAYARAEIIEYWVVNLKQRQVTALREPSQGDYQSEITVTGGMLYPVAFPSVAVAVNRLLNG